MSMVRTMHSIEEMMLVGLTPVGRCGLCRRSVVLAVVDPMPPGRWVGLALLGPMPSADYPSVGRSLLALFERMAPG